MFDIKNNIFAENSLETLQCQPSVGDSNQDGRPCSFGSFARRILRVGDSGIGAAIERYDQNSF
jgi:hypothetical protein